MQFFKLILALPLVYYSYKIPHILIYFNFKVNSQDQSSMPVSIFKLKSDLNSYKNVYTAVKFFLMTAVTYIKATSKSGYTRLLPGRQFAPNLSCNH